MLVVWDAPCHHLAGAGVRKITIYDGDRLEASNLHRQPLYSWEDIASLGRVGPAEAYGLHAPYGDHRSSKRLYADSYL